jgi:hypothetical protein
MCIECSDRQKDEIENRPTNSIIPHSRSYHSYCLILLLFDCGNLIFKDK